MVKMLLLSVILLQLSFSSCMGPVKLDMTCNHRDVRISGNLLNEKLGINANEIKGFTSCKWACQTSNKLIATCTAWDYTAGHIASVAGFVYIRTCELYNGKLDTSHDSYKYPYRRAGYIHRSGPVYCPSEKKANVENAVKAGSVKAGWIKLVTCSSKSGQGAITCAYSKTVGISKSKGDSTSSSTTDSTSDSTTSTASAEMSLTYGVEGGDPFGLVKTSLQASASISASVSGTSEEGYSWTSESSNSATFENSDSTTTSATVTVAPGVVASICQPRGQMDAFVIHANHFERFPGTECP